MEFYLPEEYLIICTGIALNAKEVTVLDVLTFMNKCPLPIEYEEEGIEFKNCTFNEGYSTFTINFDELSIPSRLVRFSHEVWDSQ